MLRTGAYIDPSRIISPLAIDGIRLAINLTAMSQQLSGINVPIIERIRAGVGERILMLVPSPGAEIAAAAALIDVAATAGAKLKIVYVTDAIPGGKPPRLRWRAVRAGVGGRSPKAGSRAEAVATLDELGIAAQCAEFYGFPVGGLTLDLLSVHSRLYASVHDELRLFQPTLVIAPSRLDLHPDYNAVGLVAELACADLRDLSITCLAYTLHGDEPPSLIEDFLRVPIGGQAMERKRRAASRLGLSCPVRNVEHFQIARGKALDALASEFSDGVLRARIASRRLRTAKQLQVLPTDPYLHSASIRVRGRSLRATLGNRASDDMAIDKTASGLEFSFSSAHGPVWIKAASRQTLLDAHGWFAIQTLPRAGMRSTGTCCMVHRLNDIGAGRSLLETGCSAFENVIVVDDGSSEDRLEYLRRLSASSQTLHVIVQPTRGGAVSPLLTAFHYAMAELDFEVLVTLDAERVRSLGDIPRLIDAMQREGADIAIGVPADPAADAWPDRLANAVARGLLRFAYRRAPRNVQSGFRAYRRTLVKRAAECLEDSGEDTEIKLLALASDDGRVAEVPVAMRSAQHGRGSLVHIVWQVLRAICDCAKTKPARATSVRHHVAGRGF